MLLDVPLEAVYVPGQVAERYVFKIDQPRRVGLWMEPVDGGDALHLQGRIFDTSGNLVTQVVAPVGQPLLREEWDLAAGQYQLQLFGPEERPRAFTLTLISRPVPINGGGRLSYGETRSGEIAVRGQRDQWVFAGQSGDRVLITVIVPAADGYLELYDAGGQLLAKNDDSHLGHNPELDVILPGDGDYMIVVRMYDDDQTGVYRIALERQP
jgi:hypothetical protein